MKNSHSFLIYYINVCPGDDLQTFYPSEADANVLDRGSKLIQTNLTEAYVKHFMNLNSLCLVRLLKSSTFGQ